MDMRKISLLTSVLFMSIFMLTGCASKSSADGHNSFYDEVNCITFLGLEFHLGDTLSGLKDTYTELDIDEETMIPPEDIANPTFTDWSGQKYVENIDTALLNFIYNDETKLKFLYATVINTTDQTMSSYSLPINQYDNQDLSSSSFDFPEPIRTMIAEHIEDEEWSYYDEEKLCYAEINTEKRNKYYYFTANIIVYKDNSFNENLDYQIEGIYYTQSLEELAEKRALIEQKLTAEEIKNLPDLQENSEVFLNDFISLQKHTRGIAQSDKTQDYAGKVLDFVKNKRNEDYFLKKGDTTYTILQSYQDFLSGQDLIPTIGFPYTYQPIAEKLGAYGNASLADTGRYTFTIDEEDSNFRVYPNITNFSKKTIDTMDGLVTKVERYGGYSKVTVPEVVENAIGHYWLDGNTGYKEYEFDNESVVVCFTNNVSNRKFYECMVEVTPHDYPEITICYETTVVFSAGVVTDAHFWLKEEMVGQN